MDGTENFDLHATLEACGQAAGAIICHVFFQAALHGLIMALGVGLVGFILNQRGSRPGKPLLNVCGKLSIFCLIVMIPGIISLILQHKLPDVGVYNVNSLGFIVFWTLICLHLSAEEMNFQWFLRRTDK